MVKRFLGTGCIVLVAFAAACTTEIEPTEAESLGSTSQAVIDSICSGGTVKSFVNFGTSCSSVTTTTQVTSAALKVNHVRAQSYFAYLMGGPLPPATLTIGQTTYPIRDSFFSTPGADGMTTYAGLCSMRTAIAAGRITVNSLGSDTLCSTPVGKFSFTDNNENSISISDAANCGWSRTSPSFAAMAVMYIGANLEASNGWCPEAWGGPSNLPSYFKMVGGREPLVDPEPVTLNAGQTLPATGTYSSSTNAAATGNDTGAAYAQASTQGGGVFRWPSSETTALSTTQLAIQFASKPLGVPCFTADQTGTQTTKYLKKGMLANKYLCQ